MSCGAILFADSRGSMVRCHVDGEHEQHVGELDGDRYAWFSGDDPRVTVARGVGETTPLRFRPAPRDES